LIGPPGGFPANNQELFMKAGAALALEGSAAVAPRDPREEDSVDGMHAVDPALIRADQTDHLFRKVASSVVLMLAVGAAVVFAMWDVVAIGAMSVWISLLVLASAGRLGLQWAYLRATDRNVAVWLRWFAIGAFSAGAVWGLAGALFLPAAEGEHQVFLATLLAAMLSGGVPVLAVVWQVYAAYAIALIVPVAYVFVAFGSPLFVALGLLSPLLLIVNVLVAFQLSQTFVQGFTLRRAYRAVAADQRELNEQLQEQLDQLAQAHAEVAASGHKLSIYVERAPIAVFELDSGGTVLAANPAAETQFGHASTEIEGRNFNNALFDPSKPLMGPDEWGQMLSGGVPVQARRAVCLRKDGIAIDCEFSLTPLVGSEGELMSIIVQCQDITKQLESERLKQEFTSTLSHELRTPLTSIIGSLQLINSGVMGEVDAEVAELTGVAERNSERLLDMINDILDIEKIDSGRFELHIESIRLDSLVKEALVLNRAFAERFKVSMALVDPLDTAQVQGDRKRLMQVFTNLMSNAAKFSPEGGAVDVSVRRNGDLVRVAVEDRGSGIPAEFRGRIFSRFSQADSALTRKKGGTGLGLAISKRMAELMGGTVGFADRAGGGTTFFVDLPAMPVAAA